MDDLKKIDDILSFVEMYVEMLFKGDYYLFPVTFKLHEAKF